MALTTHTHEYTCHRSSLYIQYGIILIFWWTFSCWNQTEYNWKNFNIKTEWWEYYGGKHMRHEKKCITLLSPKRPFHASANMIKIIYFLFLRIHTAINCCAFPINLIYSIEFKFNLWLCMNEFLQRALEHPLNENCLIKNRYDICSTVKYGLQGSATIFTFRYNVNSQSYKSEIAWNFKNMVKNERRRY